MSKSLVPQKDLIRRNIHDKYKSSSTHCSKVIRKVKNFKKWVKPQGQGHRVKNNVPKVVSYHWEY